MSTFTIRVTASSVNSAGTGYGQSPDLGAPSYFDMYVTGSSDPTIPNGVYDAFCLNPLSVINFSPTAYSAQNYAGNVASSFVPIGFSTLAQSQVDQLNWLLAQRFTSDSKFGGQYNFGEVQLAIWKIVGFTDAQIAGSGSDRFLNDNNRNVVNYSEANALVTASQNAVASGNGVLPTDAYFSTVIDPAGNVQPLIVQLQSAKLGNFVWLDGDGNGTQGANEVGVDQVVVELWKNGVKVASTLTGDDFSTAAVEHGFYQFAGLAAGNYQVKFVAPTYDFTAQDANSNTTDAVDSDANALGFSQVVALAAGESNQTIDAGLIQPATAKLSGYVYVDLGNDGVRNSEPPIAGVTVTLTGTNDLGAAVTATTTTDAAGFYEFTGLRAGNYTVTETQPAAYLDGKDTAGSTGGSAAVNDVISNIALTTGANSVNNNFGELPPASLSGFVYEDAGNDGLKGAGEAGIAGVTVTLTGTDDLGNPVSLSTTTDANGGYSFSNLRPGSYSVVETQPAGYLDGKDTAGSTGGAVTNDAISTITLAAGANSVNNNFGELPPASLSGFVYEDVGNDGVRNAEPAIAGVLVTLTGTDDLGAAVTATATTNAAGFYEFVGLRPGTYTVTETQPAAYVDGKDTAGSTGGTVGNDVLSAITLVAGANSTENNFGELPKAAINGFVYCDDNNDGIKQAGEVGFAGVTVKLSGTDDLGQPVTASTTTDANGAYSFTGLRPGSYTVTEFTQPAGKLDGKDTAGTAGGNTTVNEVISSIVLTPGQVSNDNNFGEILPAKLSGYVYEDVGNDGVKGAGEAGIAGVTVKLTGTDDLGNAVSLSTTTAADGSYSFLTLRPGTYSVTETQPAAYLDGKDTAGSTGGTVTNDAISTITLGAGVASVNNNFGELKAASLAGFVYEDNSNDGAKGATEAGIGGVTVKLTGTDDLGNAVALTTTTAADGSYSFANLRPGTYSVVETQPAAYLDGKDTAGSTGGTVTNDAISTITLGAGVASVNNNFGELKAASLSGFVYQDAGNDGVKGVGEAGIAGVTVKLTGTNDLGQVVSLTATTDANGAYSFVNLRPGTYAVVETQPAGYLDGKDTAGSTGGTVTNDAISTITLGAGVASVNNNFGELKAASLGDRVWYDTDRDGVQDANETGVSGVTVNLLNSANTVVGTQLTNGTGNYLFSNLATGVYSVQFVKASLPAGFAFTSRDAGGNTAASDATDSDADVNTGATIQTTLDQGENDLSWDAGIVVSQGDLCISKTDGLTTVSPGQVITYTIVASNVGSTDAYNALVSDVMPANLTNISWTSVASGGATGNDLSGTGNIFDTVNLTVGSSITYTVTATVGMAALIEKLSNFGAGTENTGLGQNITINGVRADAFYMPAAGTYATTNTQLWQRNVSDDHGLGVSSNGEPNPATSGGDVNELSNQVNAEVIRLTKADGDKWTALWVSSLDGGGSGGAEMGTLYWSNTANPNLSTLTTKFSFKYGDFGPNTAEGNVLALNPPGFDGTAKYVYFVAGPNTAGCNNDYLVWKASTVATGTTLVNTATVSGPSGFTDTNAGNNSATDTDTLTARATLGDFVWHDKNANGLQEDGEAGIAGVTVNLRNAGGSVIGTTTTDSSGHYSFGVAAGTYSVAMVAPSGYVVTSKDVGSNDAIDSDIPTSGTLATANVTLAAGQSNMTLDAGFYKTASIGDRVWFDVNENGVQDGGEVGVANVTVNLLNASGTQVGTTTTDTSGNYLFSSLRPGTYSVEFKAPAGYSFTGKDAGANDAADSDADKVTGRTIQTVLDSGEVDRTWDAGIAPICKDVNFAFSGNSAQSGTAGNGLSWTVGGVTATALAFSRDRTTGVWAKAYLGSYGGGLGVTDSSEGTGANNTHTIDNTGNKDNYILFQFSQIVSIEQVGIGYVVNDSDFTLWAGSSASTLSTLSDSVLNGMGYFEQNTTTLTTARTAAVNAGNFAGNVLIVAADTLDTSPEDFFKLQALTVCAPAVVTPVAKASIGNFVWEDKNYNGVQDTGEAGIAGVTVKLLNSAGTAVVSTTTTDANGAYLFSNLTPADYKVQVVTPSGYLVTKKDVGSDAADSDIDSTGTTVVTTLSAGENDLSWDAGFYRKASVGDKVWEDKNHNNIQDTGEAGIGGITVKLLNAAGTTVLGTTTTNSSGNYLFSNLDPGAYTLQFDKTNVSYLGVNMSTWKWAVKDTGSNDAIDSDVTGNATATTNVTVTSAFTLVSGQADMTRDAGITPIVIDLDGNGIRTISRDDATAGFDLFGNGGSVKSGWISGGDGFLAVDKNGNGKIDSINELFGGTAKGAGFANLAAYDSNHDGFVNDADAAFGQLMIWRDANGNHATDAGELMTLAQAGVASLTVAYTELPFVDAQGNLHLERSTATLANGSAVSMTDVYFNVSADDAAAAGVKLPTIADLLGDDRALDCVVGASTEAVASQKASADVAQHGCDAAETLRRLTALTHEGSHQAVAA